MADPLSILGAAAAALQFAQFMHLLGRNTSLPKTERQ